MIIRRLEPHEVELHREMRLRALCDAPHSFGETYEAMKLLPVTDWERRTAHVTNDETGRMFVASIGEEAFGCVYGLVDVNRHLGGRVGGMWVDSYNRRSGVGSALLQAVLEWAEELALKPIALWAPAHEETARSLYWKAGFYETGRTRPLPTEPHLKIVEMELDGEKRGEGSKNHRT